MTDIKNTEYITVNANGVFVGGKTATTYRGQKVYDTDYVKYNTDYMKRVFAWMQEQNPNIIEFHIGAFVTPGEYAKPGNPDGVFGPNAWCRVKYKNGNLGAWVFFYAYGSAADCASYCAGNCAYSVRNYASFRSAVFDLGDKQKPQESKYKGVKLYKKTENYPIQNPIVLSDKNGNYHVAFDSRAGHEEFSGTRAEVLQQMTRRVKRLLNVR